VSFGATVIVTVPLVPRAIVNIFGIAARAKFPNGLTVRAIVVVAVRLPEVPVMVTIAVPIFAVWLAVKETALADVAGLPLKEAVTPFGSPDADRVTFPENPFAAAMLIALVPFPTLCTIVTAPGADERVKCGFA
jgi:hypothetical protein